MESLISFLKKVRSETAVKLSNSKFKGIYRIDDYITEQVRLTRSSERKEIKLHKNGGFFFLEKERDVS